METGPGQLTGLLCNESIEPSEKLRLLLPIVYRELRALAQARLNGERVGHTLSATALVHEAYLKFVGHGEVPWRNRAQFLIAAGNAMRQVLVDYARGRGALKRGGNVVCVNLKSGATLAAAENDADAADYLALDEALSRLKEKDPRAVRVVLLRFFVGLTNAETAEVLEVSERMVKYDWEFARKWLAKAVGDID